MKRSYQRRGRRSHSGGRWITVLAVIVVCGVLLHAAMLASIVSLRSQQAGVQTEIDALGKQVENYNRSIESYHSKDRILARAQQLGMVEPSDSQIRVLSLPALAQNTVQSVENTQGEASN